MVDLQFAVSVVIILFCIFMIIQIDYIFKIRSLPEKLFINHATRIKWNILAGQNGQLKYNMSHLGINPDIIEDLCLFCLIFEYKSNTLCIVYVRDL